MTNSVGIACASGSERARAALQLALHKLAGGGAHDDDVPLFDEPRDLRRARGVSSLRLAALGGTPRACNVAPFTSVADFSWFPSFLSFCRGTRSQAATL